MTKYHYRPKDNRTPVTHPIIGHLDYDGVYEHPDCADNPDFVEVHDKKDEPEPVAAEEGASNPEPVTPDPVTKSPGVSPAKAGKTGRS